MRGRRARGLGEGWEKLPQCPAEARNSKPVFEGNLLLQIFSIIHFCYARPGNRVFEYLVCLYGETFAEGDGKIGNLTN